MPKVSVCTPLYNTEPVQLDEMIKSVLSQTYTDYEFLLLNDSPDNRTIKEIVLSYSDKRIRYIENELNIGISASRNKLIHLSKGDYLAVCDHDDISLPERFEKQIMYLESHPDIGVVSVLCSTFGSGNRHFQQHPENDEDIKKMLCHGCYVAHPAAMIRKKVMIENNIFYKEEYSPAEDYKLWIDLMQVTNFYNIQEYLLKYRTFEGNTSVRQKEKMELAAGKIIKEIKGIKKNNLFNNFISSLSNFIKK